jgi:DNA repair exonuclease SbcCD ATPase subunit
MGHVTKEELAEINEELTETLQRLDQENTELMKEVKTGAIDDLEEKRDAIMDDLEGAQEAVNAAVREQQETAVFTILVAGLTALIAAAGVLWMQKVGVNPMHVTVVAGLALLTILVVKWARNWQASKDL